MFGVLQKQVKNGHFIGSDGVSHVCIFVTVFALCMFLSLCVHYLCFCHYVLEVYRYGFPHILISDMDDTKEVDNRDICALQARVGSMLVVIVTWVSIVQCRQLGTHILS